MEKTFDFSTLNVGDKVVVDTGNGGLAVTTIIRITPTGRVRIDRNPSIFFDKYGNEMGHYDTWIRCPRMFLRPWTKELEEYIIQARLEQDARKTAKKLVADTALTYEQSMAIIKILED